MATDTDSPLAPILPTEGRHVLHAFFRLDMIRWAQLDSEQQNQGKSKFLEIARNLNQRENTQLILFTHIGPDADWGFMLLMDDLRALDRASRELHRALGAGISIPVQQYFSVTETSEYTTTEEEYLATLEQVEGIRQGTAEFEEKRNAFRARMQKYLKDRLYPNLPDWPVVCFYPMSKRRNADQNWYSLPFAKRKELMQGHARVGRGYAGRILQLITGSTGLDTMEWGVTLFAKNVTDIKAIVYEMRFDPVSAEYADFGNFRIGLQLRPGDLIHALGL